MNLALLVFVTKINTFVTGRSEVVFTNLIFSNLPSTVMVISLVLHMFTRYASPAKVKFHIGDCSYFDGCVLAISWLLSHDFRDLPFVHTFHYPNVIYMGVTNPFLAWCNYLRWSFRNKTGVVLPVNCYLLLHLVHENNFCFPG